MRPMGKIGPQSILIRGVDPALKARLRRRAAQRGHSMEREAREILRVALFAEPPTGLDLAEAIHRRFAPLGGVVLKRLPRETIRKPPKLS